ncbi:hypothetical protein UCDDA912_g10226 [Diaporthe ampelina]|uniref:Uncharacterized protein n=1 Tax=Diaporthe ampelina TaxID=1214573 RepID=A0A0G2F510_9PEZI|nr:hypothetical protein UCDDA912_g10226 [Diaporthe ampelina]
MDEYEQRYRRAVQASPPRVYVDNVGDAYAETVRIETAKWDLEHFNPRNTFRINLDRSMLKALVANEKGLFRPQRIKEGETDVQYNAFVKKQDHEFQELRFLLAVTFFHELHHGFVAYLAGNTTVFTPTTASYMASASDEAEGLGESGSFAERNVLGGVVIMDPPPSSNQIGTLQIITEEKVYRIGYACLKTIKTDPHSGASTKYYKVYGKHASHIAPIYNLNLQFEGTQLRPKVLLSQEVKVTA